MKKLIMVLLVLAMGTMISQTYAQELKSLIKKRETSEETTEGEEANKKGVIGNVNKGIDKFQEKFLGNKNAEENEEEAATEAVAEESEEVEEQESSDNTKASDYRSSDKVAEKSMMKMFGLSGNVTTKEKYEFDGYMKMVMNSYDKKGKLDESTDYYTYLSESCPDYAMVFVNPESKDKTTIIYDTENLALITLGESDGEKTGFAIGISPEDVESMKQEAEENAEESEDMPSSYYKTGRSKKICGYNCDEYKYEDEEGDAEMWITQELNGKMSKGYMKNATFTGTFSYAYGANGSVLEYVFTDKDNGEKMTMTVDEIDLNKKHTISTSGYNIMSMRDPSRKE